MHRREPIFQGLVCLQNAQRRWSTGRPGTADAAPQARKPERRSTQATPNPNARYALPPLTTSPYFLHRRVSDPRREFREARQTAIRQRAANSSGPWAERTTSLLPFLRGECAPLDIARIKRDHHVVPILMRVLMARSARCGRPVEVADLIALAEAKRMQTGQLAASIYLLTAQICAAKSGEDLDAISVEVVVGDVCEAVTVALSILREVLLEKRLAGKDIPQLKALVARLAEGAFRSHDIMSKWPASLLCANGIKECVSAITTHTTLPTQLTTALSLLHDTQYDAFVGSAARLPILRHNVKKILDTHLFDDIMLSSALNGDFKRCYSLYMFVELLMDTQELQTVPLISRTSELFGSFVVWSAQNEAGSVTEAHLEVLQQAWVSTTKITPSPRTTIPEYFEALRCFYFLAEGEGLKARILLEMETKFAVLLSLRVPSHTKTFLRTDYNPKEAPTVWEGLLHIYTTERNTAKVIWLRQLTGRRAVSKRFMDMLESYTRGKSSQANAA